MLRKDEGDSPEIEVVEKWITYTGSPTIGDSRRVQAIVKEFQETALIDSMNPDQLITTISTNANDSVLDEVVRILGPSGVQLDGRVLSATTRPFLQHRVSTFPLMTIDDDRVILQVEANLFSELQRNMTMMQLGMDSMEFTNTSRLSTGRASRMS